MTPMEVRPCQDLLPGMAVRAVYEDGDWSGATRVVLEETEKA